MSELSHLADLKPDPENARLHNERNLGMITSALEEVGAARSIVIDEDNVILAGNGVYEAALAAGMTGVQVVEADGETIIAVRRSNLTPEQKKRLALWDNRTAELAEWNPAQLLADLDAGVKLADLWSREELDALLSEARGNGAEDKGPQIDKAEALQEVWRVQTGDVWQAGEHYLICGDCRDFDTWQKLAAAAGVERVNGVFTSPPYAEQRKAQYGGVPTAEYVDWWEDVQANARAHLAGDGSLFVNIKPHCEDGQRVLYVFDLVLAMVRRWGWRFVDELCWINRATPGYYPNRFKDGFEPVYQFSIGVHKFCPDHVKYHSDDSFVGPGGMGDGYGVGRMARFNKEKTRGDGYALPSNVIIAHNEVAKSQSHAAQFPVALPDFFIRAYSDAGDVWCDPFLGSGTTIVAAHKNERRGVGIEALEKYVSVSLQRLADMSLSPHRVEA